MRITVAILALTLASCGASAADGTSRADLVISSGTQGRLASAADPGGRRRAPWIEIAADRDTFTDHWNRYVPGAPDNAASRLDFDKEIAVFLLLGPQQTGGYAIEPIDVTVQGGIIRVKARLVQPMKPEDFTTQAITAPWAVVRAPAVTFERVEWIDADGRLLATRVSE
jgi:hypothetical protein